MAKKHLVLLGLVILIHANYLVAEENSVEEIRKMPAEKLVELLKNPDWRIRDDAIVYGLRKFRHIDERGRKGDFKKFAGDQQIKVALIELLKHENSIRERWWEDYEKKKGKVEFLHKKYGEGYGEYCLDLADAVIHLKDRRSLTALVGVVECGGMPKKAVVEFGEDAVAPLIDRYEKTKNYTAKDSIIDALGKIVETKKLSDRSRKKIKDITIKALDSENPFARKYAVHVLGIIGDTDVIPILKSIVNSDPYTSVRGGKKGERIKIYPVREEAEKVLKQLKVKKAKEKSALEK